MPTYHHGDLRRALLDATVDIVEERGVNGVNMAEAARRAGVSSGAPYKHFRDKDDLLAALAEYSSALVLAEIANVESEHAERIARVLTGEHVPPLDGSD